MEKLNILCTSDNKDTLINMVAMYTSNYFKNGAWDEIIIILWGGAIPVVGKNTEVGKEFQNLIKTGITIKACKACADKLNCSEELKELGIEVKYMGNDLTDIIKSNEHLITI